VGRSNARRRRRHRSDRMTPAMRGVSPKRPGGLWEQSPRGPPSTSDHSVGCHAG
jgi:hypothetical protein